MSSAPKSQIVEVTYQVARQFPTGKGDSVSHPPKRKKCGHDHFVPLSTQNDAKLSPMATLSVCESFAPIRADRIISVGEPCRHTMSTVPSLFYLSALLSGVEELAPNSPKVNK